MIGPLATGLIVACLLLAGFSLVPAVVNRPLHNVHVWASALVEFVVLVQLVVAVVLLASGERPDGGLATFLGYLVASVLVLPAGVLWAASEKSRWSGVVLGVAALVLVVVVIRLEQVWSLGA